ncbi:hypothetical protein RI367_001408 [Sorochytrium milnesiophthora]
MRHISGVCADQQHEKFRAHQQWLHAGGQSATPSASANDTYNGAHSSERDKSVQPHQSLAASAAANKFLAYCTPSSAQYVVQHSAGAKACIAPTAEGQLIRDDSMSGGRSQVHGAIEARHLTRAMQLTGQAANRSCYSTGAPRGQEKGSLGRRGRLAGAHHPPAPVPPPPPGRDRGHPQPWQQQQPQQAGEVLPSYSTVVAQVESAAHHEAPMFLPPQLQRPLRSASTSCLPTVGPTGARSSQIGANAPGALLRCPSNSVLLKPVPSAAHAMSGHGCSSVLPTKNRSLSNLPSLASLTRKASSSVLSHASLARPESEHKPVHALSQSISAVTSRSESYVPVQPQLKPYRGSSVVPVVECPPVVATKSKADVQRELNQHLDDEYGMDVLMYSLERETLFIPKFSQLPLSPVREQQQQTRNLQASAPIRLTPPLRRTLIESIITICDALGLKTETMHLAIMAFDCFLAKAMTASEQATSDQSGGSSVGLKLRWDHFQLAIIVSVFTASKFSETKDTTPFLSSILQLTNHLFTAQEVIRFESRHFLPILDYELSMPTADYYLHLILGSATGIVSLNNAPSANGTEQAVATSSASADKSCLSLKPHERTLLLVIARFVVEACMSDYDWCVVRPVGASLLAVVSVLIASVIFRRTIPLEVLFEKLPWLHRSSSPRHLAELVDRAFALTVSPPPIVLQKYNRQNNYNIATIVFNYLFSCSYKPFSYTSALDQVISSPQRPKETMEVDTAPSTPGVRTEPAKDGEFKRPSPGRPMSQLSLNVVADAKEAPSNCKKRVNAQNEVEAAAAKMTKVPKSQRMSSVSQSSSPAPSPGATAPSSGGECTIAMVMCADAISAPLTAHKVHPVTHPGHGDIAMAIDEADHALMSGKASAGCSARPSPTSMLLACPILPHQQQTHA